jgi:hypothetical protein
VPITYDDVDSGTSNMAPSDWQWANCRIKHGGLELLKTITPSSFNMKKIVENTEGL